MSSSTLHFVAVPWISLSHCRQMTALVHSLVQRSPVLTVTILTHRLTVDDIAEELQRFDDHATVAPRIRVIGIVAHDPAGPSIQALLDIYIALSNAFEPAYRKIVRQDALVCTSKNRQFDFQQLPTPSVVLYDMYIRGIGEAVRQTSPTTKCLLVFPSTVGSFNRHYGPELHGGLENWERRTTEAMGSGLWPIGSSRDEVARGVELHIRGEAFPNPDGVRMFDYELRPQKVSAAPIVHCLMESMKQVRSSSDGAVVTTFPGFEPAATSLVYDWYKVGLGKQVFLVGPQIAPLRSPVASPTAGALEDGLAQEIFAFLDGHTQRPVCLISFGTLYFPYQNPSYVTALLRILLQHQVPFIFSRASETFDPSSLPSALLDEMRTTGLGLVVDFFPQREVLAHRSVVAFVTTGSVTSMWECIQANVMPVFWPFAVDQPLHAALMTTKLDCAFELIQVRDGPGAQPPMRGGNIEGTEEAVSAEIEQVIADLDGDVGARKKRNLEQLRHNMMQSMEEGGESHREIGNLIDFGTPETLVVGE